MARSRTCEFCGDELCPHGNCPSCDPLGCDCAVDELFQALDDELDAELEQRADDWKRDATGEP